VARPTSTGPPEPAGHASDQPETVGAAAERWVSFFEHIDHYHRFYGALLGSKGSPWFAVKMRASLSDMVKQHLLVRDGLVATALGAMFTQSITWWLDNGMPRPPRVIAMQSAQLASAVIAVANGWTENPPT
jgi:hypothetical protein